MKICVTGHRPNKLYGYNLSKCVVKPLALAMGSVNGVNIGKSKSTNCYIKITPRDNGWK